MPEGYGILLSFKSSRHALGPTQLVPRGATRPGRHDNHSSLSCAEVKKFYFTFTPSCVDWGNHYLCLYLLNLCTSKHTFSHSMWKNIQHKFKITGFWALYEITKCWNLRTLTLFDPTSDLVRQYDFSSSDPMSADVRHGFCCVCPPAVGTCPTLFLM
jgi:hypothetical protein